jgi:hypothetical protein
MTKQEFLEKIEEIEAKLQLNVPLSKEEVMLAFARELCSKHTRKEQKYER